MGWNMNVASSLHLRMSSSSSLDISDRRDMMCFFPIRCDATESLMRWLGVRMREFLVREVSTTNMVWCLSGSTGRREQLGALKLYESMSGASDSSRDMCSVDGTDRFELHC